MTNNNMTYADNNATTRVAPEVVEEMLPYFSELYGNPSSIYQFGEQSAEKIAEARNRMAELLGSEPDEIIFTSCGTESDNAAIFSAIRCFPTKKHIITTSIEHPAILNTVQYLEGVGYRITYLGVDHQGRLDLDELKDAIGNDTVLVSIMYANNEIGNVYPIEKIGQIVKSSGVLFHTDAVQVVGKIPLNLKESTVDMLSLSGHKFHAPKGVGALFVREGAEFTPFLIGGHQEQSRRGGTENVASIIGMGKAAELAKNHIEEENSRVKVLRDRLEETILNTISESYVNGDLKNRLPNTSNMSFEGIKGEEILMLLNQHGICLSTGSACTSGSLEPSHVLTAMHVPPSRVRSVRFSFSRYNSVKDIEYILTHLTSAIKSLRSIQKRRQN